MQIQSSHPYSAALRSTKRRQTTLSAGDVVVGLAVDETPDGLLLAVGNDTTALLPWAETKDLGELRDGLATFRRGVVTDATTEPPKLSERVLPSKRRLVDPREWPLGKVARAVARRVDRDLAILDVSGVSAKLSIADVNGSELTHLGQLVQVGDTVDVEVLAVDATRQFVRVGARAASTHTDTSDTSRQTRVLRLLRHLIQTQEFTDATLGLLSSDASLLGTLCGAVPFFEFPLETFTDESLAVETDVAFLAHRVRLLTGFGFSLTQVPGPDDTSTLLLCNVTLLSRLPEAAGVLRPIVRFRDRWRGTDFRGGSDARLAAHKSRDLGWQRAEALTALFRSGPLPEAAIGPTSVRHLGMLTLARSYEDIDLLMATIQAWDENFALFGHRGISLLVSDDSDPVWRSRVRAALSAFQGSSGLRLSHTGRPERDRWIASVADTELREALEVVVGGHGPCQNRNWSLLNLPRPCLQLDDDLVPEVLTTSRAAFVARYIAGQNGGGMADSATEACPLDVLGTYAEMAVGALGSPVCSGADDVPIDVIAEAASRVQGDESMPDFMAVCADTPRGLPVIKGPVFIPAMPKVMPLQPPIRDGDEAYVSMLGAFGRRPSLIPTAIRQRVQAGSRSTLDELLWASTKSQLGWRLIRAATSKLLLQDPPNTVSHDLETVGQALMGLAQWPHEEIERLWLPRLERSRQLALALRSANGQCPASKVVPMRPRLEATPRVIIESEGPRIIGDIVAYGVVVARWHDVMTYPRVPVLPLNSDAS